MKYSFGYYNFLGGPFCFGHFKICNVRTFGFFRILVGVLIDYGCFTKLPLWQFHATNLNHTMYIEQTPNPQGPHTLKQTFKTFDLVPTQCTYINTCWGFELVPIELCDL
jgi:hypothetical protein